MRRQPFILLSFSSSKKARKAQQTQSYQHFRCIGHTGFNTSGTNGPRGETGAFPPSSTAGLCAACEIALSAAFVTLIPQRFYIHTFPGSLWPPTISNSSTSDHLSSRFSTSPANGPRSLSQTKVGTHSALLKKSHTGLHAETGAVSDGGAITTLGAFHTFTNIPGPGIRTAYFAAFGSWPGVLTKNTESLRNSDAHHARRCSEASRPRWAA